MIHCKHSWKVITEQTMDSPADKVEGNIKGDGIPMSFFQSKYVCILQCIHCGKLDKTITENPSLPDDWEEGMKVYERRTNFLPVCTKYTQRGLHKPELENNPEFWKKIIDENKKVFSIRDIDIAFWNAHIGSTMNTECIDSAQFFQALNKQL